MSPNYGPNPSPQKHFFNNEKLIYLRKIYWFDRRKHIPKKSHCVRCPASYCCAITYVALSQKILETLP